jgi:superkiller protein 3
LEALGQLELELGEPQVAIEYFNLASNWGSLSLNGNVSLGIAYNNLGDVQNAIGVWENALENYPPNAALATSLAQSYLEIHDYKSATSAIRTLIDVDPTNAWAHYQLGVLLSINNPESAPSHLVLAVQYDESYANSANALGSSIKKAQTTKDSAYVSILIGQTLAAIGEWELATIAFEEATLTNPEYAEAWAYLGESYHHIGRDGLPALQRALEIAPNSLTANIFQGFYWLREGKAELALVYLHAAANLETDNPALQADIGLALVNLGELPSALTHYQRAANMTPKDPEYWKILSEFAVFNEIYVEDVGLPAARNAVILAPEDPEALVLMGRAHYLLEEWSLAQRFFERAIEADPDYAPSHLHLGLLFLTIGKNFNAHSELSLAISLAPDSSTADQAQRLLALYFP